MKRRLIALLLCICMLSSMTVYATDDVTESTAPETAVGTGLPDGPQTEPTVPETSAPASEPTVPTTVGDDALGVPESSDPTVPETSAPASEPTVPETSAPAAVPTEPSQVDVPAGPAVGDTIYIKSGSLTYKAADENSAKREVVFNYKTKIVSIVTDELGNAAWYEFEPTGWLLLYKDYKFVKVENTTITDPDASEPTESEDPEGSDSVTVDDGNIVAVTGIPEGAELVVDEPNADDMTAIQKAARMQGIDLNASIFAYDLTIRNENGDEWQPSDAPVVVELSIPELSLEEDEVVKVFHNHNGNVEMIETTLLEDGKTIRFEAIGFSAYSGFTGTQQPITGTYFYNVGVTASTALSTILKSVGATAAKTNYTNISTVESSNTALITTEKTTTDEKVSWNIKRVTPLKEAPVTITVTYTDNTKVVINITDQGYKYYLDGTDWDFGDGSVEKTITPNGSSKTVTVKVNKSALTETDGENHRTTYVADSPNNGTHLVIYMRAGQAIKVNSGFYFPYGTWVAADYEAGKYHNNNWTWVYGTDETDAAANFIIADDVDEPVATKIQFRDTSADDSMKWIINAVLYIIPEADNEPSLVRETLRDDDIYEVAELPITLYNYDGPLFNAEMREKTDNKYLGFYNYSKGVSAQAALQGGLPWNSPNNNPNGSNVANGIMKPDLENGLPVVNATGVINTDLFSTAEFPGKKVHENVGFEFIYNKNTGYYTYSSNLNHAQFNGTDKIELYNESMAAGFDINQVNHYDNNDSTAYSPLQNSRAGFYPFADINKAFLNGTDKTPGVEFKTWREALNLDYFQQNGVYAKDPVTTNNPEACSTVDMHFGIQVNTDFYMPAGRQVDMNNDGVKEDLIYKFTGDDDLWVYIDGRLALDIGGAHTALSGEINFTKQTVTVQTYMPITYDSTTNKWNVGTSESNKVFTFADLGLNVGDDQMHKLQIFYLERWSGESNCRMIFNLPLIPDGSALVTKNVLNDKGEDEFAIDTNEEYTFVMYTANNGNDDVDAADFEPLLNKAYTIVGGDGTVLHTDSINGEFILKDGQTAQFGDIGRFTEVYVVEKDPTSTYKYSKVVVNGAELSYDATRNPYAQSDTKVMPNKGVLQYTFTNYMEVSDLTISKELIDPYEVVAANTEYKVDVQIAGSPYTGAALLNGAETSIENGRVSLKADDVLVIENIPTNVTYSVVETDPETTPGAPKIGTNTKSGYKYLAPTYKVNDDALTTAPNATLDDDTAVVITNELKQLFGNLKITKTGIDPLDHHEENGANKKETQSTIYTVSGTSYSGETVNLEVVIVGNSYTTINHLPIGEYTVKEKTEWAWRYELTDEANERTVEVEEDKTAETTYNNERTKVKWLSGDSYCKNWWGGTNGTVTKRS